jgi:hypothetical protein
MFNPTLSATLETDKPFSIATVSPSPSPNKSFFDPTMVESLNQLAPAVLMCVTLLCALHLSVQLMEQLNRFIELVKKQ